MLQNGRDALIVSPRSSEQLGEAILRLYQDDEFRRSIAVEGAMTVQRTAHSSVYRDALLHSLHSQLQLA
jgi:hypothetical protein